MSIHSSSLNCSLSASCLDDGGGGKKPDWPTLPLLHDKQICKLTHTQADTRKYIDGESVLAQSADRNGNGRLAG